MDDEGDRRYIPRTTVFGGHSMDDDQVEQDSGITRREALKRGAIFGGALVWATPVVQMVGMRPAFAQVPSPTCASTICSEFGDPVMHIECVPTSPDDEACFCCCTTGLAEFCSECSHPGDPCAISFTCGPVTPGPCP
jgi:hypothetical protein